MGGKWGFFPFFLGITTTSLCHVDRAAIHLTIQRNDPDDWVSPRNLSLLFTDLFNCSSIMRKCIYRGSLIRPDTNLLNERLSLQRLPWTYRCAHFIANAKIKAALFVHGIIDAWQFRKLGPIMFERVVKKTVVRAVERYTEKKKMMRRCSDFSFWSARWKYLLFVRQYSFSLTCLLSCLHSYCSPKHRQSLRQEYCLVQRDWALDGKILQQNPSFCWRPWRGISSPSLS